MKVSTLLLITSVFLSVFMARAVVSSEKPLPLPSLLKEVSQLANSSETVEGLVITAENLARLLPPVKPKIGKLTSPKSALSGKSIYVIGSSTLVGKMGSCLASSFEQSGVSGGAVGFCGLASRTLTRGGKYSCLGATANGSKMKSYLMKNTPFAKRKYLGKPFTLTVRGQPIHLDLAKRVKPDLIAFYLGDNEAGYKKKRPLATVEARNAYTRKLRSYLHVDKLVAQLPASQKCAIITPTWVSQSKPGYGKTNAEVKQLVRALRQEVGNRCTVISGIELMRKSDVHTSDGMHLGPSSGCLFGKRAGKSLLNALRTQQPKIASEPVIARTSTPGAITAAPDATAGLASRRIKDDRQALLNIFNVEFSDGTGASSRPMPIGNLVSAY